MVTQKLHCAVLEYKCDESVRALGHELGHHGMVSGRIVTLAQSSIADKIGRPAETGIICAIDENADPLV